MTLDGFLDIVWWTFVATAAIFFAVLCVAIVQNTVRNGNRPGD